MTDTQQEKPKPKNLIPHSVSQAFLAGGSVGTASLAASLLFDVPAEQALKMASGVFLSGAAYSLFSSWQDSRYKTAPRKRKSKGRQIPFNSGRGSQTINMEFSASTGSYIARESYSQAIRRFMFGTQPDNPMVRQNKPVDKPKEFDEFVFYSEGIQLRECHVKMFLAHAWKYRSNGKGLSARHWVRNFDQRPMWYKELSPVWYYSLMSLMRNAKIATGWQLIIEYDNGWRMLANEPDLTRRVLKSYESEKNKCHNRPQVRG